MTIVIANLAACSFLKTDREHLVDRPLSDALPGVEESPGYGILRRAVLSGEVSRVEVPSFSFPDRWLSCEVFPFENGAGCLFRDISPDIGDRLHQISQTATIAAISIHGLMGKATISSRGLFADLDDAFASALGFTRDRLLGIRFLDVLAPASRTEGSGVIETVLAGGRCRRLEVRVITKAFGEQAAVVGLVPIRENGGISGAIAVMTIGPPLGVSRRPLTEA